MSILRPRDVRLIDAAVGLSAAGDTVLGDRRAAPRKVYLLRRAPLLYGDDARTDGHPGHRKARGSIGRMP